MIFYDGDCLLVYDGQTFDANLGVYRCEGVVCLGSLVRVLNRLK